VYTTNNINTTNDLINISKFDLPNKVYFTMDDVFNSMSALKGNRTVGPDGICGEFLYQIRSIIAFPLFSIFRRLLDEGIFPSISKLSNVTPILKPGI